MKIIATLLLSLVLAAPAYASSDRIATWTVYTFFDAYNWREYRSPAERLLKESGPLYGVGSDLLLDLHDKKLLLKVKGEIFGSVVDYRGETQQSQSHPAQSQRPVSTHVDYVGTRVEGDIGWRFPLQGVSVQPFTGLGARWWLRGLEDSTAYDSSGRPFLASGYTETWRALYATAGVRGEYRCSNRLNFFMEGGARYPFYVSNSVDVDNLGTVTLRPKGQFSALGEVGATYRHLRLSLHYEGFSVTASPVVAGFLQPKSSSDLYGVRIGWSF